MRSAGADAGLAGPNGRASIPNEPGLLSSTRQLASTR